MPTQQSTQLRLEAAERIIREPSFRQNKGLGNEVGYYVFDYPAKDELIVREWIEYSKRKNKAGIDGYGLAIFDLYDLVINTLEQEGFLDQCFTFEKKHGMDRVIKAVGNMLRLGDDAGMIVDFIQSHTPGDSIVFLTGVGKCYPVLRSHKVLNNLHQAFDKVPVILFYPGVYDGQELVLFGSIKDDNYYRAFRLVE
ncbi:MAG: DUF1788 domain-containing protein [Oscillospiraceae bacterium]|jgi:hypothetical protein|nr:DUF1788 domain-containing protein [Oscillospiraceae bacterium]